LLDRAASFPLSLGTCIINNASNARTLCYMSDVSLSLVVFFFFFFFPGRDPPEKIEETCRREIAAMLRADLG